jgi:drug/metabolite transporter (DMT)-like permease
MNTRQFGALLLLAALWGASFLFMRIAAPVLGPFLLMELRVLIAGFVLLGYAWLLNKTPDLKRNWRAYLMIGTLNAAIPFSLFAAATVHITASMAAILNATTPLFAALVSRVWLQEQIGAKKMVGLILGLLGVIVLVGWSPLPPTLNVLIAVIFCLIAAMFYAIAGVYAKRSFHNTSALTLAIGQQLAAAVLLFPVSVLPTPRVAWPSEVVIAVIGLALLSTAVAYLLYFYLIASVGPTKTLSVTILIPLFGVLWGVLFVTYSHHLR